MVMVKYGMMTIKGWRMKKMKTYWWVTGFHVHVLTLNWSFFSGERLSTVLLWPNPELAAGNLALTQEMADRPNFISSNTAAWHTLEYCTHIPCVSYDWLYWVFWYMAWFLWAGEDRRPGLSLAGRIHGLVILGQEGYMIIYTGRGMLHVLIVQKMTGHVYCYSSKTTC